MTLDPNKYRKALDGIRSQLLRNDTATPQWRCTEASAAYHIPLLAVALYALRPDVVGENAAIRAMVASQIKFYGYNQVEEWVDKATT